MFRKIVLVTPTPYNFIFNYDFTFHLPLFCRRLHHLSVLSFHTRQLRISIHSVQFAVDCHIYLRNIDVSVYF